MGRGKKKDKKPADQSQPSTSSEPPKEKEESGDAQPVKESVEVPSVEQLKIQEEPEGLAIEGTKKNRRKKKPNQAKKEADLLRSALAQTGTGDIQPPPSSEASSAGSQSAGTETGRGRGLGQSIVAGSQPPPGPPQSQGRGRRPSGSNVGPPQGGGWGQPHPGVSTGPPPGARWPEPSPSSSTGPVQGASWRQPPMGVNPGPPPGAAGWAQASPRSTTSPSKGASWRQPPSGVSTGPSPGAEWAQPSPSSSTGPPQGPPGLGARSRGRAQAPPGLSPGPPMPGRSPPRQQTPVASEPPAGHGATKTTLPVQLSGPSRSSDITVSRYVIPDKVQSRRTVQFMSLKVITNYLPMTIKPREIYRYDVSFTPDKPKKMIPKAYALAKKQLFPNHVIAFDQMKNCYALSRLPNVTENERYETIVEFGDSNGKPIKFEVSFKATGVVYLESILKYMTNGGTSLNPPTEAIQCIDVILRQGTLESYIKAGRQFFKRPPRPIDLGDGLEMWTGLFQSAIFTSRAFVNVDVAHKGFPKQQWMIDALVRDFRLSTESPIEYQRGFGVQNFKMFIKNLRVIAKVGGDANGHKREFICNDLARPPGQIKFTMTDNLGRQKEMTVEDYFVREKKVRIRYPNLNCMSVGPRNKNIFYPLEFLEISYGRALNKQLNASQLSNMIRQAATPADDRKRKIEEIIGDMKYSTNPYFKQFGIDISEKFYQTDAKVLRPPLLDIGSGDRTIEPRNGKWQANSLLKPEALSSWGFISIELDARACDAENMISMLQRVARNLGMHVTPPMMKRFDVKMNQLQSVLFNALDQHIKFLFIVIPGRGLDYYHKVKRMAERDVGILTQCVKENTAVRRMNQQTVVNILLKVNAKLMGINQALNKSSIPYCIREGGVMVVGADVTHPSPEQTAVPSIAAVTASIDDKCFVYNIQLSIQTPKKEMIVEFEDMMQEHLKVYRSKQNALPRKIYVFRDGVSEGQFAQVMHSELQAVHNAYQRLSGSDKRPEVLFLLVQKRHHTRFFSSEINPRNVAPGTVVDKDIVHPKELDFYLVSHEAIKGTARPTRYHAVANDGRIPHDEVEQLTYYLCHLYSRCMRAVSYPTPTYYAHLACLRARSLTYGDTFDNSQLELKPKRLNVLDNMLQFSRMFFV